MKDNIYFNNAKFFLINLIIFGHFIEEIIEFNALAKSIYFFVYIFHIPSFVIISGFFSTSLLSLNQIKKYVYSILIPYLIFQSIFSILIWNGSDFVNTKLTLFWPHNVLWYLLSLFCWRLLLSFSYKVNIYVLITISLLICILSGYFDFINRFLSLSRTLCFLPFFILGYYFKINNRKYLQLIPKHYALLILIASFFIPILFPQISIHWLFGDCSYQKLSQPEWYAFLYRIAILCFELIVSISFLSLIPTLSNKFSNLGRNTMYAFIFHWVAIEILIKLKLFSTIPTNAYSIIIYGIISLFITFCLLSYVFKRIFIILVEPVKFINGVKQKYYEIKK